MFTQLSMLTSFYSYLFKVGVHIADVSHFIRPGNALDQESARRGTTVYLCEKVNGLNLKWNFDTCLELFSASVLFLLIKSWEVFPSSVFSEIRGITVIYKLCIVSL